MKYYYDDTAANRACNFIERYIQHVEGEKAGQFIELEQWQRKIVSDIFGWKREDGTRKYRKAYIQVPRGNGKSTITGALCNLMFFIDNEPAALITYGALNQQQANAVGWRIVSEQIRANEKLLNKVKILNNAKSIEYRPMMNGFKGLSIFRTVSRDSKALHGLNCHGAVIDEYHTHPTSEVLDTLATSMLKRKNPLLIIITTPGFNMDGPCYKEYQYARQILDGKLIDESYYAVIFESPRDADIYSEETWKLANPNYGISIGRDYFENEIQRIKNEPSYENTFRVLHLGQWVQIETTWITDHDWQRIKHPKYQLSDFAGCEAFLGFDLSSTSDITSLTAMIKRDGVYHSLNWFWLPKEQHHNSAAYKNDSFAQWVQNGDIILCDTRTVDYRLMYNQIKLIDSICNVVNIQYDPWNAAILASELEREGYVCEKYRQGTQSMNMPTKKMYEFVKNGVFNHMDNPVLKWMVGNVVLKIDEQGNQKVIKDKKRQHRKVDGVITNIMCLGAILHHEHMMQKQSYIETTGELFELD